MSGKFLSIKELIHAFEEGSVITILSDIKIDDIVVIAENSHIEDVKILDKIRQAGIIGLPAKIETKEQSHKRHRINFDEFPFESQETEEINVEWRLQEIQEIKEESAKKYQSAKDNIKKTFSSIMDTGGHFEVEQVEKVVTDLLNFVETNGNIFTHITKQIFSYDDYLYNHSINVFALGSMVLKEFGKKNVKITEKNKDTRHLFYSKEQQIDIAMGYFLHDIGKILIPEKLLNKKGTLTTKEFEIVKKHSYEKGLEVLQTNNLDKNVYISNMVQCHHVPIFEGDKGYPILDKKIIIPPYVIIGKLVDIYDALTSKRSYKDAISPISVVNMLYNEFANKNDMLQYVLHSFITSIGLYPPNSVVKLGNGQLAYVVDSKGPIVIPFTKKDSKTHLDTFDAINLSSKEALDKDLSADKTFAYQTLYKDSSKILPEEIKKKYLIPQS